MAVEGGQPAPDHGYFVAVLALAAVAAVLVDLVRQQFHFYFPEAQVPEEGRDAGEQADAGDALLARLVEQALDQHAARAAPFVERPDRDGAQLGQMHAVDVQRPAARDAALAFHHREIADVLVNFGQ